MRGQAHFRRHKGIQEGEVSKIYTFLAYSVLKRHRKVCAIPKRVLCPYVADIYLLLTDRNSLLKQASACRGPSDALHTVTRNR